MKAISIVLRTWRATTQFLNYIRWLILLGPSNFCSCNKRFRNYYANLINPPQPGGQVHQLTKALTRRRYEGKVHHICELEGPVVRTLYARYNKRCSSQ